MRAEIDFPGRARSTRLAENYFKQHSTESKEPGKKQRCPCLQKLQASFPVCPWTRGLFTLFLFSCQAAQKSTFSHLKIPLTSSV